MPKALEILICLIHFPVHTARLEWLNQFWVKILVCNHQKKLTIQRRQEEYIVVYSTSTVFDYHRWSSNKYVFFVCIKYSMHYFEFETLLNQKYNLTINNTKGAFSFNINKFA